MNRKTKAKIQATQAELIGILTAISIVSKRLAENLARLEKAKELEAKQNAR
jgi:hypothetical protein